MIFFPETIYKQRVPAGMLAVWVLLAVLAAGCKGSGAAAEDKQLAGGKQLILKNRITELFIEGCIKQTQGYPKEAILDYEAVLKLDASHHATLYQLGMLYYDEAQFATALPYAERAIKLDSRNVWYTRLVAMLYGKTNQEDKAIKVLEDARKVHPQDMELDLLLVELYLKKGRADRVLDILTRLEQRAELAEEALRQKKALYMELNQPEKAMEQLRRLAQLVPENREYRYELFELLLAMRRREEAMQVMEQLAKEDRDDPFLIFRMIQLYYEDGKESEAMRMLEQAIDNPKVEPETKMQFLNSQANRLLKNNTHKLNELKNKVFALHKDNPALQVYRASTLYNEGRKDSARVALKQSLVKQPNQLQIWEQLLNLDNERDLTDSLLADIDLARELYPNHLYFLYMSGVANYRKKNYEDAAQALEKYSLIGTSDAAAQAEVYLLLADCYQNTKDDAKAEQSFDKALELNPLNLVALNNYAYHLSVRGHHLDKALQMIEKVMRNQPDSPTYQDTYGWVLYKLGRYEDALAQLEKAYSGNPNSETADHLGDVYYKLGNPDKAKTYWNEAKQKGLQSPELDRKLSTGQP